MILCRFSILLAVTSSLLGIATANKARPRHCKGEVKHIHLAVGHNPAHEMTISFATKYSNSAGDNAPLGGVHIGLQPDKLDRFVPEQEDPLHYKEKNPDGKRYNSPYQHHITIDGLEANTTYYYEIVVGDRDDGIEALEKRPIKHSHSAATEEKTLNAKKGGDQRRRRLLPAHYDGSELPCIEGQRVRSFKTAPKAGEGPVSFAVIGDLGQFSFSEETLRHLRDNKDGVDATILAGDISYNEGDHRRWDTFFDFLDDYEIFHEIPLHIATGNHDIEKREDGNVIFEAYETRFRMPQVQPEQREVFDFPGELNMDAPSYPLPYDWGNAYYSFDYGLAKHIVLSAYSSMEPDSAQYKWVKKELKTVDRSVTPWVLVTIHTPLYNTFVEHHYDPQIVAAKEHIEPLLVKYHVNFVLTGHIHAYLRTGKVAMGERSDKGPVHITIGAGGRQCMAGFQNEDPEDWVEARDASFFGYGRIDIRNSTHAEWRWIPLSASGM
ncbi:MAG: hypothetical protein SGBAC_000251 [Bacillariaceae sp.]